MCQAGDHANVMHRVLKNTHNEPSPRFHAETESIEGVCKLCNVTWPRARFPQMTNRPSMPVKDSGADASSPASW